ncbi:MAG: aromatic ring-hydroxylating dioxygenase subunit alpha [Pseudomonadales bacterium]|nr:aromatic ring-hydroxylating dioxygenase subunit alpha [Pseudomonadales bacterium]
MSTDTLDPPKTTKKPANISQAKPTDRCPAISYQEVLDTDSRPVPEELRIVTIADLPDEPIDSERYTSAEFHKLEMQQMWSRVWQMACREEEIPNVGDYSLYEIGDSSLLITRTDANTIKAFHNSCLHRGRTLRDVDGHAKEFICPFHGFTWNLDGTFKQAPCEWDFPQCTESDFSLPEAHVALWGGFVFINLADEPQPFDDYAAVLKQHFKRWPLDHCWKAVHVQKTVAANWKATMEAFIESFHAMETHPQILPYSGDANSQYDVFDENVSRTITMMGIQSPHIPDVSAQEMMDALIETSGRMAEDSDQDTSVPSNKSARLHMADINRAEFGQLFNMDLSHASDTEVLDAILYNLFPNFVPWAGLNPNIVYRFRPNGNDPDSSIMDVMILMRYAESDPKPDPVPIHKLGIDDPWANAEELGALGGIFDQDMGNLPYVQKGLKASRKGMITLWNYQEVRIRHFHTSLNRYIQDKM